MICPVPINISVRICFVSLIFWKISTIFSQIASGNSKECEKNWNTFPFFESRNKTSWPFCWEQVWVRGRWETSAMILWSKKYPQNIGGSMFRVWEGRCTRWFKVTFSSPSWRSLNPLKGSLNHPKKVTLNHQAVGFKTKKLFQGATFSEGHDQYW